MELVHTVRSQAAKVDCQKKPSFAPMEDSFDKFDLGNFDLPDFGFDPDSLDSPACDSPAPAASIQSVNDLRTFSAGSASGYAQIPGRVRCPGSLGSTPPGELKSTRLRSLRLHALHNQRIPCLMLAQVSQPRVLLKERGPVRQCLRGTRLGSR